MHRFARPDLYVALAVMLGVAGLAHADDPLATMDEMLAANVTVEFDRLSLQSAIDDVQLQMRRSHKLGFPLRIAISGRDLEVEGITRNQQIRKFMQRDKSLADVLTALVVTANPAGRLKSPAEANQILVWAVAPDKQSILITTRAAAQAKSYDLPQVFRPRD